MATLIKYVVHERSVLTLELQEALYWYDAVANFKLGFLGYGGLEKTIYTARIFPEPVRHEQGRHIIVSTVLGPVSLSFAAWRALSP